MLGHGAGIGYTGPGPRMGPIDNFSLVTGSRDVTLLARRGVSPARPLAVLQTTTTDASEQSNTGPLGGPVIIRRMCCIFRRNAVLTFAACLSYAGVSRITSAQPMLQTADFSVRGVLFAVGKRRRGSWRYRECWLLLVRPHRLYAVHYGMHPIASPNHAKANACVYAH